MQILPEIIVEYPQEKPGKQLLLALQDAAKPLSHPANPLSEAANPLSDGASPLSGAANSLQRPQIGCQARRNHYQRPQIGLQTLHEPNDDVLPNDDVSRQQYSSSQSRSLLRMDILTVANLSLMENGVSVLQPIRFTQKAGQKLALAGESGAGKSTLLQLVGGLIQPSTGTVHANGSRVRGPQEVLVPGHPGVAYLSQKSDLPQFLRVEQVLRYANKRPEAEAQAVYELCRIDSLMPRRTDQLSGGEQQRVALARLLLGAPQLLLLDEPFSNLDRTHKRLLQGIIEDLGARLGITCLLVSHDAADVLGWADEILVLHRGRLVQQGSPERLYHQPVNEATAALFGDYNLVRGADRRTLLPSRRFKKDTALLVRPEQFLLRPAAGGGAIGTVRAVRFLGGHYEMEVALTEQSVRVRVGTADWQVGDKTSISVAAGAGWAVAVGD